ncbi:major facilitator superfamily domain-containing protein [Blakeslea trispora]|nr:major facilitator superfamily domain-containing protein [Blakeslea trispora]
MTLIIRDNTMTFKSSDSKELGDSVILYGTTWIAWLQIISITLINSAASLMWMSASSTPTAAAEWLHVSLTQLNWLSNLSAIINTFCSLMTGWSYQRFGIKYNIVFAAVMNLAGCWVRCLSIIMPEQYRYAIVLLGQAMASFGGAFIYKQIPTMWLTIAIIATISAIPAVFLPGLPRMPASPSADQDRMGVMEGYRQLLRSKSFWLCTIACGTNIGMAFSVSLLVMEAISPLGYTDQQAGYCAASLVLAGYLGEKVRVNRKKKVIPNAFPVILINCCLNGFFAYALFPVCLEFACEISYPVPESIASSLIWAVSVGLMLVFSLIIDSLRAGPDADPPNNMKLSMIVAAIIVAIGSLPVIWLKGQLKRLAVDQQKN